MADGRITLHLPVPPSVNQYWRMGNGHMHISNAGRAYKQKVAVLARNQNGPYSPLQGPVSVVVTWWRKHRRGDLDNTLKATLDALKGIAYEDDAQVSSILATRVDEPAWESRITVTVEPL